ncbi:LacI family DNA-binding transcriptional regulator [Nocardioides nitrophenolicus]|uniref:LacI family DNA-binding transcriptional regulator n=1 Tax=Nocardioides nitrophenolicus TaxID=60489 RepID=UPI001EF94C16|nr:LacI family DNA-binding transcriptional regulator [Nocardioides nitrophenolicus]MBM7518685.1 LacI family transcriptional regulator [Nocardioides nitrophenolicus]
MSTSEVQRSVSVKDVASAAGVSVGTVSNVLNRPEKVSPATLEHVQEVIAELGFVRNDAARQLRAGTNRAVGMVVLDVRNPFFTDVARGVELSLGEHRRPLILGSSGQDAQRESTYLDLFEEQRVSGLLITPVGKVLPRLRRLRERGTAVVVVDRRTGSREFSSVAVDDLRGGRLAARHLLDSGRRRLALLGGPRGLSQVKHRLRGAQEAVDAVAGARLDFVETATMDAAAGRQGAEQLMSGSRRPDAIFAANDLIALGVLQALTLAGLRVPDDVAILGYDDIDFAASAAIPLSSVRQPREEMGAVATGLLLDAIADPTAQVRDIVLEPELVVRRSTGG